MSYDPDRLLRDNLQRLAGDARSHLECYENLSKIIQDRADYISRMNGQFASVSDYANRSIEACGAIVKRNQEDSLKGAACFEGSFVQALVQRQAEFNEMARRLVWQGDLPSGYTSQVSEACEAIVKWEQKDRLKDVAWLEDGSIQAMIKGQAELGEMASRLAGYGADADLIQQRFAESIISTEALLDLDRFRSDVAAAVVRPLLAFQEFSKQQLELAATASGAMRSNRLALIDAAADLLGGMNKGLELGALMYPAVSIAAESTVNAVEHSRLVSPSAPVVNVYNELALELKEVDLEEEEAGIDVVVNESRPARITQLGERLVRLVYNFNVQAEREGKPPVFKPTSRTLLTCGTITARVATDETSFKEVVDDLYFLLYEGSGEAARLTESHSKDRLEALWRLKSLRRGARHDVNHGTDKEILRQNRHIGESYKSLINKVMPKSRVDWANAQVELYGQLVNMLEGLWYIEERGDAD